MNTAPVMVAFGGGLNSAAMLVGLVERGERPDAILFADTGAEKPETYQFVRGFTAWLASKGFPEVIGVANDGKYKTLERNCLETNRLPSPAYGGRSCSDKYKQRPQHKWAKNWPPALECWVNGERVVKLIGYGYDEIQRAKIYGDGFYVYRYPLIEWKWDRAACEEAMRRHGLPVPLKSACFFCPFSKKREVLWLAREHPELFDRSVAIERAAENTTAKGLGGGRWSWERLVEADRQQMRFGFSDPGDMGCVCQGEVYEGEGIDTDTEREEP